MQTRASWHSLSLEQVARELESSRQGLAPEEVRARLERFGPNRLEPAPPPSIARLILHQFQSPLIYVLLVAAGIALALGELSDAGFIAAVLLINAVIGFVHELRAERGIRALSALVRTHARVLRGGRQLEVDGEELVPGDVVLLESGARVAADLRLFDLAGLRIDESLLTGESMPVEKRVDSDFPEATPLADRRNLAFAGSLVVSGRGRGLVVATGDSTEVGAIARDVQGVGRSSPPLIQRMERFARQIGLVTLVLAALVVGLGVLHGQPFTEVLLSAVALAVSAIPEGLPIALTVALAVGVSRMVKRRVVVRNLPAVEGLGSCDVIATDKTGTLTVNQLTVERVAAGEQTWTASGAGYSPEGELRSSERAPDLQSDGALRRLLRAGCLANEGDLVQGEAGWQPVGDPTDVALLALAHKAGADPESWRRDHREVEALPFEAERRYAASLREAGDARLLCLKGAPEQVLSMCSHRVADDGEEVALEEGAVQARVEDLMGEGYRVIALADASLPADAGLARDPVGGLRFLGLIGMTDPPRQGVDGAIAACHRAGIRVVMVTGDHAKTATAIARRIGLAKEQDGTLTGSQIEEFDDAELARRLDGVTVVARATPAEKLRVVRAFQARGAFVAVTGDGVNDAPALRQANLGVAMGESGTDVAREASDLIITDDDFSSIVAGVEEGRIAYDNVRKATFLLISTGAAEVLLVLAAIGSGLATPLSAVQLLWLNLVTNGIQGVAVVFEPGEPGVLDRPPRPPRERIVDRLMIRRTVIAAVVMSGIGLFSWFRWSAEMETSQARVLMVNLFVLFEVFHIGNARSESIPFFRLDPRRNPLLLIGTLTALAVHLAAMHLPWISTVLGLAPLSLSRWIELVLLAAPIVLVMEAEKLLRIRKRRA